MKKIAVILMLISMPLTAASADDRRVIVGNGYDRSFGYYNPDGSGRAFRFNDDSTTVIYMSPRRGWGGYGGYGYGPNGAATQNPAYAMCANVKQRELDDCLEDVAKQQEKINRRYRD